MIHLTKLYKEYVTGQHVVRAVNQIDLFVPRGAYVAIMGPSGSGKSSLLNLLGCLDQPTSGSYKLDNIEVSGANDDQLAIIRNRKLGFVFQSFNLLSQFTAVENVELPLLYANVSDKRQRSLEALAAVGLAHRAHHKPMEMSGGERQRVAIARAIVTRPPVLLADEPTGNLDTHMTNEVLRIFRELHRTGVTIVLITHEDEVGAQAERLIRIRDGRIDSDRAQSVVSNTDQGDIQTQNTDLEDISDLEIETLVNQSSALL